MALAAIGSFSLSLLFSYVGIGGFLKIGPCLMAFFFYWSGNVFISQFGKVENLSSISKIVLIIILSYVFIFFAPSLVNAVGFVNGQFPAKNPLTFILCSFSGVFCFVLLFSVISKISFRGYNTLKGILRNIARNSLIILAMHYWALVIFHFYISPYISQEMSPYVASLFVLLVCAISIALFRTRLYMFIGGKRARQDLSVCFSIK